ncbi:hypothetical protein D5085_17305 [Ectothiorhodospiraceae bacterium BW-2]|nr:hypothetical protein D5085_17305 [Ectothiorhodospiraceae bacterium BW-2]
MRNDDLKRELGLDEEECERCGIAIPPQLIELLKESTLRAVIWGFVGTLFGVLFAFFYAIALPWGGGGLAYLLAGTLSSGVAALIYGSMRLTVILSFFVSAYGVFYLIWKGEAVEPLQLFGYALLVGIVVGAGYGLFSRHSRVGRADAKSMTGLVAGAVVSLLVVGLFHWMAWRLTPTIMVAILCPVVGLFYTRLVLRFIGWFEKLLPPPADGALVGMAVSLFVTVGLWLIAASLDPPLAGEYQALVVQMTAMLPTVASAGLISGMVGGFISGWLWQHWLDM